MGVLCFIHVYGKIGYNISKIYMYMLLSQPYVTYAQFGSICFDKIAKNNRETRKLQTLGHVDAWIVCDARFMRFMEAE